MTTPNYSVDAEKRQEITMLDAIYRRRRAGAGVTSVAVLLISAAMTVVSAPAANAALPTGKHSVTKNVKFANGKTVACTARLKKYDYADTSGAPYTIVTEGRGSLVHGASVSCKGGKITAASITLKLTKDGDGSKTYNPKTTYSGGGAQGSWASKDFSCKFGKTYNFYVQASIVFTVAEDKPTRPQSKTTTMGGGLAGNQAFKGTFGKDCRLMGRGLVAG